MDAMTQICMVREAGDAVHHRASPILKIGVGAAAWIPRLVPAGRRPAFW